jgi:hypothetical protein
MSSAPIPAAAPVPDRTTAAPPAPLDPSAARTAHRGAVFGFAATAAWIALGAESVVRGGEMHYRDVLWTVPWVLTILTFAHLHALQRHRLPGWGRAAGIAVIVTMVILMIGQVSLVIGLDFLTVLAFPAGVIAWLVAMIPFGVATAKARILPRRVGVALVLLEPGSILAGVALSPIAGLHDRGNFSGGLEKGLIVLMLAMALEAAVGRAQSRAR